MMTSTFMVSAPVAGSAGDQCTCSEVMIRIQRSTRPVPVEVAAGEMPLKMCCGLFTAGLEVHDALVQGGPAGRPQRAVHVAG